MNVTIWYMVFKKGRDDNKKKEALLLTPFHVKIWIVNDA